MTNKGVLLSIVSIVILGCSNIWGGLAEATQVWTSGHHVIDVDDAFTEVYIYNDVTLDILGGQITKMGTFDATFDTSNALSYAHMLHPTLRYGI